MDNLILLIFGEIVLLLFSLTMSKLDLFSPSVLVNALFIFSTSFALSASSIWDYEYSIISSMTILVGLFVFNVCECFVRQLYVGRMKARRQPPNHTNSFEITKGNRNLFIIFFVFAFIVIIYEIFKMVRANGYSGEFDLNSIATFYHRLSFMESRVKVPSYVNVLLHIYEAGMYVFIFSFLYRVIWCKDRIIKNLQYLLPVVGFGIVLIMRSNRGQYLTIAGYMLFISYIFNLRKKGWVRRERSFFRYVIRIGMILPGAIFAFYTSTTLIGRSTTHTLFSYMSVYLGGPIIHFNQFMTDPPNRPDFFGQETFGNLYSLFNRLGITDATFSTQLEFRKLNSLSMGNVYTFFRRPLNDFGMIGMLLVTIIVALVFSVLYYKRIFYSSDNLRDNWYLILYAYLYRVLLLFWFDNYLYSILSFGMFTFFVIFYAVYMVLANQWRIQGGKIQIKRKKDISGGK